MSEISVTPILVRLLRLHCSELQPCKAKVAISEIRIPLEWREFEHTKSKPGMATLLTVAE